MKRRRLLIVEHDRRSAEKLAHVCRTIEVEAKVSDNPARTLGLAGRENWGGAILGLGGDKERVLAVADVLARRSVPFVFVVNDAGEGVPPRFARIPQLLKPLRRERIIHLVTTYADAALPERKENPVLAAVLKENEQLKDYLTPFALQVRQTVFRPACPLREILFIESGLCAVVGRLGTKEAEIGQIGSEGMVGGWVAADIETAPFRVTVQIEGMAAALPVHVLTRAMEDTPKIRTILMRYQHELDMQFAMAAIANATLRIENRLARWLVMCSDRVGVEIPVVHEDLSVMLSVRRPGVTEAFHHLAKAGLIKPRRGFVRVVDRERLVMFSMGTNSDKAAQKGRRSVLKAG